MQGSDKDVDKKDTHLRLLSFADYAQEFLRRNPRYRSAYRRAARTPGSSALEREVMAHSWGLCFPVPP